MRAGSGGNLCVPACGQGRVPAFNKNGILIGQMLPDPEGGRDLHSISMAIRPGTDALCIVTDGRESGQGAAAFHAQVFAEALPLHSHQ